MAILTASELKTSAEARRARVDSISDAEAVSAIADAEALLNLSLGYKVANAATSISFVSTGVNPQILPERVRTITSVTDAYPDASPSAVTDYSVRGEGFKLFRTSYTWRADNTVVVNGTFGYATTDDKYRIAKRFVLLAAVRQLQHVIQGGLPAPAGALLTGMSSENASFTFFTPNGETTGYGDLDNMLDQIGRHPGRRSDGLYTISLQSPERITTFDHIIAGIAEE